MRIYGPRKSHGPQNDHKRLRAANRPSKNHGPLNDHKRLRAANRPSKNHGPQKSRDLRYIHKYAISARHFFPLISFSSFDLGKEVPSKTLKIVKNPMA